LSEACSQRHRTTTQGLSDSIKLNSQALGKARRNGLCKNMQRMDRGRGSNPARLLAGENRSTTLPASEITSIGRIGIFFPNCCRLAPRRVEQTPF
jgi:hypothetical protein